MDEPILSSDSDELSEKPSTKKQTEPGAMVLKEISIRPTARHGLIGRSKPSPSPSTAGSSRSNGRGLSSEYDTPLTSAFATPAESTTKGESSLQRRGHLSKVTSLTQGPLIGKRKRKDGDELEADARLAQALQAEEYAEKPSNPVFKNKLSKGLVIEDSDEDESSLSDLSMEDTDDDIPLAKRKRSNKRTVLPARRARRAATDSVAALSIRGIGDSEEESESEFSLSDSEEVYADSDIPDEDVPSTTSATPAPDNPSATAAAAPIATRPARRRRHIRTDTRRWQRWRERRIEGLTERVSPPNQQHPTLLNWL